MAEKKKQSGQKTYEYIFDHFAKDILTEKLKMNDKLPTEREIAESLEVSRNSVREVMHMLEMQGMIECIQGSGNYVCCEPVDFMTKLVTMYMTLMGAGNMDIYYIRAGYEHAAVRMAAERATAAELREMRAILEKMDQPMSSSESAKYDQLFHLKLMEASHNPILISFYRMILNLISLFIENFRVKILANKTRAEALRRAHWDIYHALENKDVKAGVKALDQHFEIVFAQVEKMASEE